MEERSIDGAAGTEERPQGILIERVAMNNIADIREEDGVGEMMRSPLQYLE
jgi:hypothetical protein